MKEARRWRRDDTGLKAEEKRVLVRRMNSDWRSAQWQLNDLRSVDSVSINQTALSRSPPFFFPHSPLGSNFPLCLQPLSRRRAVLTLCSSLSPFLHHLTRPSLSFACSLTAPSTGQFFIFVLHLCIGTRLKEWGHFNITLYRPCCGLSMSGEKKSLRELGFEGNLCPCWLQRSLKTGCDPCRWGSKFRHGNTTSPDMFAPGT